MGQHAAQAWLAPAVIVSLAGIVVALGLGVFSIIFSAKANARSARNEDRETERRDVEWKGRWIEPTLYEIRHVGTTPACDVQATLVVDGEVFEQHEAEVAPRSGLQFYVSANTQRIADARDSWQRKLDAGVFSTPRLSVHVMERITWQSPLGAPDWHRREETTNPQEPPKST